MASSAEPARRAAEPSDRDLERLVLRAVAALVAVVLAAGVAVAVSRSEDAGVGGGALARGDAGGAGIGPASGADVAAFVADRRLALERATGERAAVVSFERYLTEGEAGALAGARALLVAGPGGEPAVVSDGVAAWVVAERRRARDEASSLESLLATTDQADFADIYREDIDRYTALATLLEPDAPIVFAIAVVADAGRLRALGRDPAVRLVDVGDSSSLPDAGRIRGLRPEERVRAGQPPYRPLE